MSETPKYTQDSLKAPGTGIAIKGTVNCDVCKGTILLNATSEKGLIASLGNVKPGEFALYVPVSAGDVNLTAIGDDNGDGQPTAGEPLGGFLKNPVRVGTVEVSGVTIQVGKALPPPAAK